jgi:hypothetical protein
MQSIVFKEISFCPPARGAEQGDLPVSSWSLLTLCAICGSPNTAMNRHTPQGWGQTWMALVGLGFVITANRNTNPNGGSSNPTGLRTFFSAAVGGGRSHCTVIENVLLFCCEFWPLPYMVLAHFHSYRFLLCVRPLGTLNIELLTGSSSSSRTGSH